MKYVVAVDLGGTKIKAALLRGKKILKITEIKTNAGKGRSEILSRLFSAIDFVIQGVGRNKISAIGIGVPGLVDRAKGTVINAPNLPGWNNLNLSRRLKEKFGVRAFLENDAAIMAWGEFIYGAAKNKNNVVCITLGTGLGGGLILNKQLYFGKNNAGEIGHMVIVENGYKCTCGNRGCLEQYVSSRAISRLSTKAFGKPVHPLAVQKMAEAGNKKAANLYFEVGSKLGLGLANIINLLEPDVIVLGGGLSKAGSLLSRSAISSATSNSFVSMPVIVASRLNEDASLLGIADLLYSRISR